MSHEGALPVWEPLRGHPDTQRLKDVKSCTVTLPGPSEQLQPSRPQGMMMEPLKSERQRYFLAKIAKRRNIWGS